MPNNGSWDMRIASRPIRTEIVVLAVFSNVDFDDRHGQRVIITASNERADAGFGIHLRSTSREACCAALQLAVRIPSRPVRAFP